LENAMRAADGGSTAATAATKVFPSPAAKSPKLAAMSPRQAQSQSKRSSPALWILVAALTTFAGIAGWHWFSSTHRPETIAPPPASVEPAVVASENAIAPTPIATPEEKQPSSAAAPKAQESKRTSPAGVARPAVATAAPSKPSEAVSAANQPTSKAAAAAGALSRTQTNPSQASSAMGDRTPYLLVGWFQREDRAQDAAKKIEDVGLPVVVLPRQNPFGGKFFAVLSGPFGPRKLPEAKQQLEIAGFAKVHPVKNLQVSSGTNQ
jgi:hypothetical protein